MDKNAWIFDIDGVLTDLNTRTVSEELLSIIAKINARGEPVAFVTGRSYVWVEKRVLDPLKKHGNINFPLIFISCEKGGVKVTFKNGEPKVEVNQKLAVPQKIQEELKKLVKEEFSETMFYDPKLTMATTEAKEDVSNARFRKNQKELDTKLIQLIDKYNLKGALKLDSASIATDVENVNVGKGIGANDVLDWLADKSIIPDHFYTFGDREGDIEVPTILHSKGFNVTCVFTGGVAQLKTHKYPFELIITSQLHERGVLHFFNRRT